MTNNRLGEGDFTTFREASDFMIDVYRGGHAVTINIHAVDQDGMDYEYPTGAAIMNRSYAELISFYDGYKAGLPGLEQIVDEAMRGVWGDYDALEDLVRNARVPLRWYLRSAYDQDEQEEQENIAIGVLEDLFNYIGYCIHETASMPVNLLLFLDTTEVSLSKSKIKCSFHMSDEELDTVASEEDGEDDYVEIVNAFKKLYTESVDKYGESAQDLLSGGSCGLRLLDAS